MEGGGVDGWVSETGLSPRFNCGVKPTLSVDLFYIISTGCSDSGVRIQEDGGPFVAVLIEYLQEHLWLQN